MRKQRFEREIKLKMTKRMDDDLAHVADMAGLFKSEIIRNAIRNELTRLKKELRESFLTPEDHKKVRDIASDRGIPIEVVLHEMINAATYKESLRQNTT